MYFRVLKAEWSKHWVEKTLKIVEGKGWVTETVENKVTIPRVRKQKISKKIFLTAPKSLARAHSF